MLMYFQVFYYLFIYKEAATLIHATLSFPISKLLLLTSLSLSHRLSHITIFFSDGFSGGLRRGLLPQPLPPHTRLPPPPPRPCLRFLSPPRTLRLPRIRGRMAGPPHVRCHRRHRRPLQAAIRVGATYPGHPPCHQVRRFRRELLHLRRLSVRVLRGGGDSVYAELQTHFPSRLRGPLDRSRSENVPSV